VPWYCYVDESGDTGALPSATSPVQPVLAVVGLAVGDDQLAALTTSWIDLKRRFFGASQSPPRFLDSIKLEVKGSELRRNARGGRGRRKHRAAVGFLDRALDLLEAHDGRIFEALAGRGGILVAIRTEPRAADALAILHSYGGGNAAIGAWTGRV